MPHTSRCKPGFSLVELVVVAPMVILLIGAVIAATIQISMSSLRSYARSQLQYDILSALDAIEQDVSLSTNISDSSSTSIYLDSLATNVNPLNPDRKLVRKSDCEPASDGISISEATIYGRSYYIDGGSLTRGAIWGAGKWCGGSQAAQGNSVWQRPNNTETLIRDAAVTMNVTYVSEPGGPTTGLTVELTGTRSVSGDDISYTGRLHVQSRNIHE